MAEAFHPPRGGLAWSDIKKQLEIEGAKNKAYDDNVDGILNTGAIPDLSRSKVTDFFNSPFWGNIPDKPSTFPPSAHASSHASGGADELSLDAGQITSGVFDSARIPDLDAGKITSGVLDAARIPNLDASKITSGVFDSARIPDLDASKITSGVFDLARIPTITRSKLEYPTEDVNFTYLGIIGKLGTYKDSHWLEHGYIETLDNFTDKSIEWFNCQPMGALLARHISGEDTYYYYRKHTDGKMQLLKEINGSGTELYCGESVANNAYYWYKLSISGSTLKVYKDDMTTPIATVTDTTIASGKWGANIRQDYGGAPFSETIYLRAPSSPSVKPVAVVEVEIVGDGSEENPFKPNLLGVEGGTFDHKSEHSTVIVTIVKYKGEKDLTNQVEYAKSKNFIVLKPPSDYSEAVEQYKSLKKNFPEWIAGKDNYAYQVLGHSDIEPLAVADFYYGELLEHKTHYDQIKKVPDWELTRTLEMWYERLKRVTAVTSDMKEKHLQKMSEIFKKGW